MGGGSGGSGLGGTTDSGGTTSTGGSYSTGGTISTGGSTGTGGTTSKGGSQSSGGITTSPTGGATVVNLGGMTVVNSGGVTVVSSGGMTVVNSGGMTVVNSGGATVVSSGGATVVNSGGATSMGGVTTAGGSTSSPATCTTDLMSLRTQPDYNWIPVTPPSCSVQGALYPYHDGSTCTSPSPITANACTSTGCCISGTTVIDSTGAKWGCGLGLDLNSAAGASATKSPYAGAAKGFKVTITGTVAAGQKLFIMYTSTATPPAGGTFPYKEVTGVGTYSVLFSDATCPAWATGGKCTPVYGSGAYSLELQVAGGTAATDAVGRFSNVCITSIVPL